MVPLEKRKSLPDPKALTENYELSAKEIKLIFYLYSNLLLSQDIVTDVDVLFLSLFTHMNINIIQYSSVNGHLELLITFGFFKTLIKNMGLRIEVYLVKTEFDIFSLLNTTNPVVNFETHFDEAKDGDESDEDLPNDSEAENAVRLESEFNKWTSNRKNKLFASLLGGQKFFPTDSTVVGPMYSLESFNDATIEPNLVLPMARMLDPKIDHIKQGNPFSSFNFANVARLRHKTWMGDSISIEFFIILNDQHTNTDFFCFLDDLATN